MTIPRFYVPEALAPGAAISLPEAVDHHARRVLRLRAGDDVILFDGKGHEFRARLEAEARNENRSHALVIEGGAVDREAKLSITLVQSLCALDRMDWLVEKCVELGAARLILAPAARSVVRLEGARLARRLQRWREIVIAACCQCGRNRLPALEAAQSLEAALRAAQGASSRLLLDPLAGNGLGKTAGDSVTCVVGPEGGFTRQELHLADSLGYRRARLGPRVLRTETAGLAAIGALLALHGETG